MTEETPRIGPMNGIPFRVIQPTQVPPSQGEDTEAAQAPEAGLESTANGGNIESGATATTPNQNAASGVNADQRRVRRIHIRAPRGGALRLNVGGRVVNLNPQNNLINNRTQPPARLPPLMARPLPDAQQSVSDHQPQEQEQDGGVDGEGEGEGEGEEKGEQSEKKDKQKQRKRQQQRDELHEMFKCTICLEFMRDPCGCGKCQARYCYTCLVRVANGAINGGMDGSDRNTSNSRCPTCRAEFEVEDIERDRELQHRIRLSPPIMCRYEGCSSLVPIDQLAAHEVHCPYVKVQCRYKSFGCSWVGPRADLNHHEESDCALAKISTFVQRHRQLQADVTQRLEIFGQTMASNVAVVEGQRLRQVYANSPSNPIQLVQFVALITCTTPQFLLVKDSWTKLYATAQARAAVFNFVTMVPTSLLVIKMIASSYQQLLSYHHHDGFFHDNKQEEETPSTTTTVDVVDTVLAFLNMSCLAFITVVGFYIDGNSSLQWEFFKVPRTQTTQRILLHTIAMALLASHALAMHFSQSTIRAMLVWSFVCVTSTAFPAIVTTILEAANGINVYTNSTPQQTNSKIISTGRAARPLLFGLRYAPLAVAFGVAPCVDAAIGLHLLRTYFIRSSWSNLITFDNELFLSNTPVNRLYFIIGIRLGMGAYEFHQTGSIILDSLLVVFLLVMTNFALIQFAWAGVQIGAKIANVSRVELLAATTINGLPNLRKDYSGLGMASCCLWVVFLTAIILTY